jgi:hypothetical protein
VDEGLDPPRVYPGRTREYPGCSRLPGLPGEQPGFAPGNQRRERAIPTTRSEPVPAPPGPRSPRKATVAVIKGSPAYQSWFWRIQESTRLPAALLLDAALVSYARSHGLEEPPPR